MQGKIHIDAGITIRDRENNYGVYFLYPLMEILRVVPQARFLIFAAIVIAILLFMPEGVAVLIRDKLERECLRCKLYNVSWRHECRACSAQL